MSLNKFTFGNTPAAIFLVDRLNQLDNKKFTRKISTILCEFRKIIGELIKAHQAGSVSTHTLSVTVELLHDKIENTIDHLLTKSGADYGDNPDLPDVLAANLTLNVIKGELKSVFRRSRKLHQMEKEQQRLSYRLYSSDRDVRNKDNFLLGNYSRKFTPEKINIEYLKEDINAKTLQEKSRRKLARLNKKCELY